MKIWSKFTSFVKIATNTWNCGKSNKTKMLSREYLCVVLKPERFLPACALSWANLSNLLTWIVENDLNFSLNRWYIAKIGSSKEMYPILSYHHNLEVLAGGNQCQNWLFHLEMGCLRHQEDFGNSYISAVQVPGHRVCRHDCYHQSYLRCLQLLLPEGHRNS